MLEEFPNIRPALDSIRADFVEGDREKVQSFFLKKNDGILYLIAAAVLQSDNVSLDRDVGRIATDKRFLIVLTRKMDEAYFIELASQYSFPKISLLDNPDAIDEKVARYQFPNFIEQDKSAWAVWHPKFSSTDLVLNVVKSLSIIFVCLFVLMVFIGLRALRMKRLIDQGINDYLKEKKILQQYEKAIRDLGQGPTLFDLETEEAFAKIAKYATSTLRVSEIGLWEFNEETRYMQNVACFEKTEISTKVGVSFDLDAYPELDEIFDQGFPYHCENIQTEEILQNVAKLWFDLNVSTALLIIPVRRYGTARGFVHFAVINEEYRWSEEKIRFASSLVDFVSLNFDIQDQKKIETQLRIAKNVAEQANVSKTQFLSNMSHELRTPLNAIIGFSDLIRQGIFGPLGAPQYQEYVDDINTSARHLLGLINEILEIAKTESGNYRIQPRELHLQSEVDTCLKLLEGRFKDKAYTLDVEISDELKIVTVDASAFRKILLNLLTNAVKFTVGDSKISLSITDVDDHFEIVVADNGIGISESDQKTIFDPFKQADNTLSKRFEGTGLGLSITKALVELHGGEISLQSTLGVGTTVRVLLPRLTDPLDEEEAIAAQTQKTIL